MIGRKIFRNYSINQLPETSANNGIALDGEAADFLKCRMPVAPSSQDHLLASYDFEYPAELIADKPAEKRDHSKLLALDRKTGRTEHRRFSDLAEYLKAGDCLVLNRTKVWPARLVGKKTTGGKAELLLVRELESGRWTALASGFKSGMRIELEGGFHFTVESLNQEGEYVLKFSTDDVRTLMAKHGRAPLPPYILKSRKNIPGDDLARYQTVYAREEGSIAAPTAGLHFTPGLLAMLKERGVRVAEILLHVGRGTFRPVTAEDVRDHKMLAEWYRVEPAAWIEIQAARSAGGRVVAVGTTATRTLETISKTGQLEGWTDIYIGPEHRFQAVDALITNFHLPRSSPLILASAFAGRERLLAAYREAIGLRYRLYSYGDAMLIL